MKMSKKGSEFIQILKDAGVKEYWATSEFNLEDEIPKGTIVLPKVADDISLRVDEVLNEITGNEEDFSCNVWILSDGNNKKKFNLYKERRPSLSKRSV